jgi:hypothetical protein
VQDRLPPYDYRDSYLSGEESVLRHSSSGSRDDMTWGYRNPGGVGRYKEYYPPGNRFQNENPPTIVARFDQGPYGTTRQAQLQAVSIGTQRNSTILGNIGTYGRPLGFGYGFGLGGYGGFYPY